MTSFTTLPSIDFGTSSNFDVFKSMTSIGEDFFEQKSIPMDVTVTPAAPAVPSTANIKTEKEAPARKAVTTKHKKKRVSKPRRVIPVDKEYIPETESPSDADVVSGRGGRSNHHPGNRPYWLKVLAEREIYRSCDSDLKKTEIAQSIIDFVQSPNNGNGRFLQLEDKTKRWFVLPTKVILDKVKQALRDKYVPLWARDMDDEQRAKALISTDSVREITKIVALTETETATGTELSPKKKSRKTPKKAMVERKKNDDLQEAIEKIPSFKSNIEQPMQFNSGHSLDFTPLPSLSTTFGIDNSNSNSITAGLLFPDTRPLETLLLNSLTGVPVVPQPNMDAILFDVLMPPAPPAVSSSKTDWNSMFNGAFAV